jgi:hypothetical protein
MKKVYLGAVFLIIALYVVYIAMNMEPDFIIDDRIIIINKTESTVVDKKPESTVIEKQTGSLVTEMKVLTI